MSIVQQSDRGKRIIAGYMYDYVSTRRPEPSFLYRQTSRVPLVRFLLLARRLFTPANKFKLFLRDYTLFACVQVIADSIARRNIYAALSLLVIIRRLLQPQPSYLYETIRSLVNRIRFNSELHEICNVMSAYEEKIDLDKTSSGFWSKFVEKMNYKLDRKKSTVIFIFPGAEYRDIVSEFIQASMDRLIEKEKTGIELILQSKSTGDMQKRYEEILIALIPKNCSQQMQNKTIIYINQYLTNQLENMSSKEKELINEIIPPPLYKILVLKNQAQKIIWNGFQQVIKNPEKSESIAASIALKVRMIYNPSRKISHQESSNYDLIEDIKYVMERIESSEEKQLICNSLPKNIRHAFMLCK